jgi:hypothetical protein
MYAMQSMLGYGDDGEMDDARRISLRAFADFMRQSSLDAITKTRASKSKYNYPYVEEDTFCPSIHHLTILAYSSKWKTAENIRMMANALNHRNSVLPENTDLLVKIRNNYYAVGLMFRRFRPFRANDVMSILYRRVLTEIAMLGVGTSVDIIRESVTNVQQSIDADGILRMDFKSKHNKRYSPKSIEYPTAYVDVRLESDYKRKYALECDLTFWAVQFLSLVKGAAG